MLEKIKECKNCDLWKTRHNVVIGEGNKNAKIMFIGEAPGREEDLTGRPFVGRAGKFLDEILEYIGIKRENVYITSILKCRPPNNRNPKKEEINACSPYLEEQIAIIKPKIIVTLGNFSTKYFFNKFNIKFEGINKVKGKAFALKNFILIPQLHPAAALYNPNRKDEIKKDFKVIRKYL